jgi:hypothetical protein
MNRTHLNDLFSPQLTDVALIWPFHPRGGVIARILPLDEVACCSVVPSGAGEPEGATTGSTRSEPPLRVARFAVKEQLSWPGVRGGQR